MAALLPPHFAKGPTRPQIDSRVHWLRSVRPGHADLAADLVDRVVELHARSVDLAAFVADRYDVPIAFALQGASGVAGDGGVHRSVAATEVP